MWIVKLRFCYPAFLCGGVKNMQMLKRVISITLCIAVLIIASPTNKVNAVAIEIATGIGIVIGGIIAGLGVTNVNGLNTDEFINGNSVDRNIFMNDFYNSLSKSAQDEIKAKAALVVPGETMKFEMSNKTVKEIFSLIQKNSTGLDEGEPNDSRNFKFTAAGSMVKMQPTKWVTNYVDVEGTTIKRKEKVGYFTQFSNLQLGSIAEFDPLHADRTGAIRTNKKIFYKSNDFRSFDSLGYELVNCIVLSQIASMSSNNIFYADSFLQNHLGYEEKVVGSFTNAGGKKLDITCSSTVSRRSDKSYVLAFDIVYPNGHEFGVGNIVINERCYAHGITHDNYYALYILKDSSGKYYYSTGRTSIGTGTDECGYGVSRPTSLDGEYTAFSSDFALDHPFEVTIDDSMSSIGTAVGNLDDDENILVNIPITGDGSVALPTDKTDIMDMTDATTGGGTDVVDPPDTDIEIPDLDIPNIFKKFPFSIPYDIYAIFSVLNAPPITPKWDIPILGVVISFDLSQFNGIAKIARWTFYFLFVFGLIKITRKLIKG